MKKLFTIAFFCFSFAGFAQEQNAALLRSDRESFTPAQRSELTVKKLTLELGLNTSQQSEMSKIITDLETRKDAKRAEFNAKKESERAMNSDARFALKNQLLDEQIATNGKVRKILNAEQYAKWERLVAERTQQVKK
jgi:hypothetical protein